MTGFQDSEPLLLYRSVCRAEPDRCPFFLSSSPCKGKPRPLRQEARGLPVGRTRPAPALASCRVEVTLHGVRRTQAKRVTDSWRHDRWQALARSHEVTPNDEGGAGPKAWGQGVQPAAPERSTVPNTVKPGLGEPRFAAVPRRQRDAHIPAKSWGTAPPPRS